MDLTFFCNNKICPICGFNGLSEFPYYQYEPGGEFWGNDGEICPCCGFHFRVDDYPRKNRSEIIANWRYNWVNNLNCDFWAKTFKPVPADWNPVSSLAGIGVSIGLENRHYKFV